MATESLRNRLMSHAEKVRRHEEMEAALAGVFNQEQQAERERFMDLVINTIKPAFDVFKATLREMDRDAVIVMNLVGAPSQSIGLTLLDRYLKLGTGKTLKLVNPKDDLARHPKAKFYEITRVDDVISIRLRYNPSIPPVVTTVAPDDITPCFLENELTAFFEKAYPAVP
jgi:hypothetical protein